MINKLIIQTSIEEKDGYDILKLTLIADEDETICNMNYRIEDGKIKSTNINDPEGFYEDSSEEIKNAINEFFENLDVPTLINMYQTTLKDGSQTYSYDFDGDDTNIELSDTSIAISVLTDSVDKLNDTMAEIKNILQDYLHSYREANNL